MDYRTRPSHMDGERLLTRALNVLETHWATRRIAALSKETSFDRELAARVCSLLFAKCDDNLEEFDRSVNDLILFSEEFVRLQMELDASGHYRFATFAEARAAVYDNESVMNRRYLNGLFLSIAFWTNHMRMFRYFIAEFCRNNLAVGSVLEVPSGTGIYLSEFARCNSGWTAVGMDISDYAVAYARDIVRLNGAPQATIEKTNVFEVTGAHRYDRIICGELLEHLERPEELLQRLESLLAPGGKIFLTTAVWAASLDHIYLFRSTGEAREMIARTFVIESELALSVLEGKDPERERTPVNYACVLTARI